MHVTLRTEPDRVARLTASDRRLGSVLSPERDYESVLDYQGPPAADVRRVAT